MTEFAFVFPGQGSQSVGMLDAFGDHPAVRATLQEASALLGIDIAQMISAGPKEELDLTVNTQIVMLVASVACWRAWRDEGGPAPAAVAGHSLGEYSALVAAEALTFADALPLVRFRAQAMQDAVPVGAGAMVAVLGLDGAVVQRCCVQAAADSGEVVAAANYNDPKQTVIAGSSAGVEMACQALRAAGAKRLLPLSVSAPFHSALMKPAAEQLKARLAETPVKAPRLPVVNNIDVAAETDPARIRDALYRQACGPVRWVEVVQALKARGLPAVLECGPGKVLTKIVARIDPALVTDAVFDPESLARARALVAA